VLAGVVLVGLTLVFDNIMIAAGLFAYADAHISGLRIGLVPIEDLSYPLALAIGLWTAAGLLMLLTPFPATLSAILAAPYIALAWPFRSVPDAASASANRGWRRFLLVNYLAGFAATLIIIAIMLGVR
jgi:hypothetical protein